MKNKILTILLSLFCIGYIYADNDKIPIPPDQGWSDTNDRNLNSPRLYQDDSYV